jgi:hypothetical protein
MKRTARPLLLLLAALAAVGVGVGMHGCSRECSPGMKASCEGNVIVGCTSYGDVVTHFEEYRYDCAAEGLPCVELDVGPACARPDPACDLKAYCKEDHVIGCNQYQPGYATYDESCAPYGCAQVEGKSARCVTPDDPCFTRPDGQYCEPFSNSAYKCSQKATVHTTTLCSGCYIDADGVAVSRDTNVPCL